MLMILCTINSNSKCLYVICQCMSFVVGHIVIILSKNLKSSRLFSRLPVPKNEFIWNWQPVGKTHHWFSFL